MQLCNLESKLDLVWDLLQDKTLNKSVQESPFLRTHVVCSYTSMYKKYKYNVCTVFKIIIKTKPKIQVQCKHANLLSLQKYIF